MDGAYTSPQRERERTESPHTQRTNATQEARRAAREHIMDVGDLLSGTTIDQFIAKKLKGHENQHYIRTFTRVATNLLERKFEELRKRNQGRQKGALDDQELRD